MDCKIFLDIAIGGNCGGLSIESNGGTEIENECLNLTSSTNAKFYAVKTLLSLSRPAYDLKTHFCLTSFEKFSDLQNMSSA